MSQGGAFCLPLSVSLSCLPSALPVNSLLFFLLAWTVMHFCFSECVSTSYTSSRSQSSCFTTPPLPPHLEKICLTNRTPGKLAPLSFLSIAPVSSLLFSSISPSERCPIERTRAHPQIHTEKYIHVSADLPHLCVCLFVSRLGTD